MPVKITKYDSSGKVISVNKVNNNPIVEKMKACKKCPNLGHVIREQKVKG